MELFKGQIKSTKDFVDKLPKNALEACPECNRRVNRFEKYDHGKNLINQITLKYGQLYGIVLTARS